MRHDSVGTGRRKRDANGGGGGPNTTGDVRKAYIVQFAPDGAEVLMGDPAAGNPMARVPADAPTRQFPILTGGRATGNS